MKRGSLACLTLAAFCFWPATDTAWLPVRVTAQTGCPSNITVTGVEVFSVHNGYFNEAMYVEGTLSFAATVVSNCQIQSVTAQALGVQASLTFGAQNKWWGSLSLTGQPRGPFPLTVTATDVNATFSQRSVELFHDTSPVVTVSSPTPATVARPTIRFTATCADDAPGGCASMVVEDPYGRVLATGTSSVDAEVTLAEFDGHEAPTSVVGIDSIGRRTTVTRLVPVGSNPRFFEVAHSPHGEVLADSAAFLLSLESHTANTEVPILFEKATGLETRLLDVPAGVEGVGLTTRGAIFVYRADGTAPQGQLVEWRDGKPIDLGTLQGWRDFRANQNYAIWPVGGTLVRRDLETATDLIVATDVGDDGNAVALNGDVAYTTPGPLGLAGVRRWRNGTTTTIPAGTSRNSDPRTDGVNVAFTGSSPGPPVAKLFTSSNETIVLSELASPRPLVNGGWTAFVRPEGQTARHVWLRAPDGTQTQITFFNDNTSSVEALSEDGRVLASRAGLLYLKQPGHVLQQIGTLVQGRTKAFWRDGHLYLMIGASVFRFGRGPFTDDVLVPHVTPVRALHILELRTRIDAARARVGLPEFAYADPALAAGTLIRREHVSDLRSALDDVYLQAGLTPPVYTDPVLDGSLPMKAAHIQELRVATIAVE